jgi:hypothetical protein
MLQSEETKRETGAQQAGVAEAAGSQQELNKACLLKGYGADAAGRRQVAVYLGWTGGMKRKLRLLEELG